MNNFNAFVGLLCAYVGSGLLYDTHIVRKIEKAKTMEDVINVLMLARTKRHQILGLIFFPIRQIMISLRMGELQKQEALEELFDEDEDDDDYGIN